MTMSAEDNVKRRPNSAPKSADTPSIPKIVIDDKKVTPPSTLKNQSQVSDVCTTFSSSVDISPRATGSSNARHVHPTSNMPIRSSSDLGLPATSMPNLAMPIAGTECGGKNHLRVFCSPRTSRRSVDLDINATDVCGQCEWMENLESSSNSLKVLTSSSRVGSAISLNSECTTRSIGLLSDSDSDNEESLSLQAPKPERVLAQQQEGASSGGASSLSLEPSRNRKSTDAESCVQTDPKCQTKLQKHTVHPAVAGAEKPNAPKDRNVSRLPGKLDSKNSQETQIVDVSSCGTKRSTKLLSYRCDNTDASRDERIRQWLQDMDKHGFSNG